MTTRHLIVVGVDGSDGGRRALDWAVGEAGARNSAVVAVVVIPVPVPERAAAEPVPRS